MRASIAYSLARLGIFAVCLLIGYFAGLRDPLVLLLLAATVSMLVSLLVLGKLRDQFSADVAERVEERRQHKSAVSQAAHRGDESVEDDQQDFYR